MGKSEQRVVETREIFCVATAVSSIICRHKVSFFFSLVFCFLFIYLLFIVCVVYLFSSLFALFTLTPVVRFSKTKAKKLLLVFVSF